MNNQQETGCCPRFNPEPWDEKEITWQNKLFIKDQVRSFFHIPINFGGIMRKNMKVIEAAGACDPQNIMLSDEKSPWSSDIYIAVNKEIPNTRTERLSGTFLTKVFEGPYRDAGKWAKEMQGYVSSKGKEVKKMYFWYTTCPKCAKVYGKNYTVILATI